MLDCACNKAPEPQEDTARVVTLVHGSFAQHADWIQDEAVLPQALVEPGGVVLDRFCWSGKNRHRDRLEAADALREHLVALIKRCRADGRTPEHHLIAHSHGGNVVMYALRERGEEDDALLKGVQVTTLATPFLTMRRRPLPRRVFLNLALFLLIGCLWIPWQSWDGLRELAAMYWDWIVTLSADSTTEGVAQPAINSPINPLLIAGLVWTIVAGWTAVSLSRSVWIYSRAPNTARVRDLVLGRATLSEADRITTSDMGDERLLIIRGLGDEAAVGLGGAQLAGWFMARVLRLFSLRFIRDHAVKMIKYSLATTLVAVVLGIPFLSRGEAAYDRFGDFIWNVIVAVVLPYLMLFMLAAVTALLVVPPLVALANRPFGLDALFWNYFTQTTAEPAPGGGARVLQVRQRDGDDDDPDDLSHTVYDDPPAVRALVARVHGEDPFLAAATIPNVLQ